MLVLIRDAILTQSDKKLAWAPLHLGLESASSPAWRVGSPSSRAKARLLLSPRCASASSPPLRQHPSRSRRSRRSRRPRRGLAVPSRGRHPSADRPSQGRGVGGQCGAIIRWNDYHRYFYGVNDVNGVAGMCMPCDVAEFCAPRMEMTSFTIQDPPPQPKFYFICSCASSMSQFWAIRGRGAGVFETHAEMVKTKNQNQVIQGNYAGFVSKRDAIKFSKSHPAPDPSKDRKSALSWLTSVLRSGIAFGATLILAWSVAYTLGIVDEPPEIALPKYGRRAKTLLSLALEAYGMKEYPGFLDSIKRGHQWHNDKPSSWEKDLASSLAKKAIYGGARSFVNGSNMIYRQTRRRSNTL